jgi:hypothetical protein
MQIFGYEQDFGENQRIDDSKPMKSVIDLMLRQNDRFVNGQHTEHHPEIDKHQRKISYLIFGFFLESRLHFSPPSRLRRRHFK